MHTALDLFPAELCLLKDRVIRQEADLRSCLSCLTYLRQQSIFQFNYRDTTLIAVMMHISVSADLHVHPCRQRIDYRRTHTVQTTAGLIGRVIEFTARMQCRVHQSGSRHALCMHADRHASSVIHHGCRSVFFQCHMNLGTESRQMLIHCIIHDLIDQMIQTFR